MGGEKLEMVLQRAALMSTSHGHVHCKERWNELVQSLVKKRVRSNTMGAYMYLKRRCKDV